jgi:predicted nucleotidyltransferase component of viral defense system
MEWMQLDSRRSRTPEDATEIASILHATILNELFRITRWVSREAVFHGGTSLRFLRDSPRSSEDLDFMVSEDAARSLREVIGKIHEAVRSKMNIIYPGSQVSVKGPKGDSVEAWTFTWTHPNIVGSVKVKTEFLLTRPENLEAYASTHLMATTKGVLSISGTLPAPTLLSAWSDKIVAIGMRPAFKWRDAFDIEFIANGMRMDRNVGWADKIAAMTSTAAIYDNTPAEVVEGLSTRLDEGYFVDVEGFEENMERFLGAEVFADYRRVGRFAEILEGAHREVSQTVDVWTEDCSTGYAR